MYFPDRGCERTLCTLYVYATDTNNRHYIIYIYITTQMFFLYCIVSCPFIRAMGCCYLRCATCVIAGQYATSHCKPLLVRVSL